jgi:hypothetical protein
MPVNADQLRQLLAEHSDPARSRPVPQERITARIRRARMRRAAGAGLLAIAVAAGVVSGVHLAHDRAAMTSYSGPPMPARFTAADGAAYRRLAVTYLPDPAHPSAALTLTAGSAPIDLMGSCGLPRSGALIGIEVNGKFVTVIQCQDPPQLIGLPVRPGQKIRITFVSASRLGLAGLPDVRTSWQFAAYTWQPPATARPASAAPRLPRSYTGPNTTAGHGNALRKLVASRSGTWPGDHTATFTLTFHGHRSFDISTVCAGLIGGRLQVSHQVADHYGEATWSDADPCTPAGPGQLDNGGGGISGANGLTIRLTYRIQAPSTYFAADYAKRAARWTIAVYEEQT